MQGARQDEDDKDAHGSCAFQMDEDGVNYHNTPTSKWIFWVNRVWCWAMNQKMGIQPTKKYLICW